MIVTGVFCYGPYPEDSRQLLINPVPGLIYLC